MGLLNALTGGAFDKIFGLISEAIPDPDKRAEIALQMQQVKADLEKNLNESLSTRHAADMASDSWLSKNVRPMVLLGSLALWIGSNIFAAFGHPLPVDIVDGNKWLVSASVTFYFGSKGFQRWQEKKRSPPPSL